MNEDSSTLHSAIVNNNKPCAPTVATASQINNAHPVGLGFSRMNEDSSTSCSAIVNVNELCAPTVTTVSQINGTSPVGLLTTSNETPQKDQPNDDLRNHVQVAIDIVHGMSCEQCHVLHNH